MNVECALDSLLAKDVQALSHCLPPDNIEGLKSRVATSRLGMGA